MRQLILLVLALAILPGCQQKWLAAYRPRDAAPMTTAPREGQYNLYVGSSRNPVESVLLLRGTPIGFKKETGGELFAIAGENRWMLAEAKYQWQSVPRPSTELEFVRDLTIPLFIAAAAFGVAVAVFSSFRDGVSYDDLGGSDESDSSSGKRHHHGH